MTQLQDITVGALAHAANVGVETVRYYQRRGLMPEPPRVPGAVRRYGERDVARLHFIRTAQRLGFSLDEVAQLLELEDGTHCREARTIAKTRRDEIRARLRDLRRIEAALTRLLQRCETARGNVCCPLIASLK